MEERDSKEGKRVDTKREVVRASRKESLVREGGKREGNGGGTEP